MIGWGDDGQSCVIDTVKLPAPKAEKSISEIVAEATARPLPFIIWTAPEPTPPIVLCYHPFPPRPWT